MNRSAFTRRFRVPRTEKERVWVRRFAEHGIELLIVDERYGPTNILIFGWGTVPEDDEESR